MSQRFRIVEKYEIEFGATLDVSFKTMKKVATELTNRGIDTAYYDKEVFYGMALGIDKPEKLVEKYEELKADTTLDKKIREEILPDLYEACKRLLADPNSYIQKNNLGTLYVKLI